MGSRSLHACLPVICVATLAGCGGADKTTPTATSAPVAETRLDLFLVSGRVWRSRTVPVCWEESSIIGTTGLSDADFAQAKEWVRDAAEQTWAKTADIVFTGWELCSASSKGIRIHVNDNPDWKKDKNGNYVLDENGNKIDTGSEDHPFVQDFGTALDGLKNGMLLNFTYRYFSSVCQKSLESCDRWAAAHEFGHAIGYAHEQDRDDRDRNCTSGIATGTGDKKLGAWDPNGIMNYCSPNIYHCGFLADGKTKADCESANMIGSLSPIDIMGHQMTYGLKPSGTLVAQAGHCVSLNGEVLEGWDCAREQQSWAFNLQGGPIASTSAAGMCMRAPTQTGDSVRLSGCNVSDTQQAWSMPQFELRSVGNKCVTRASDSYTELWDCAYPGAQKFSRVGGQLKQGARCLDTQNSWYPYFANCSSTSTYQLWTLTAQGQLRNGGYTSYCLSASSGSGLGASVENGSYFRIATCGSLANGSNVHQRVTFAGPITSGGQYLALEDRANGSRIVTSSTAVDWEYHP